jgi:hypothetical protein
MKIKMSITQLVLALLALGGISHQASAAPLVLDTSSPFFYDTMDAASASVMWAVSAPGTNRTEQYGAPDPLDPGNDTYFMSMLAPNGRITAASDPTQKPGAWDGSPSTFGYGISVDFYVPTVEETSFENNQIFGLSIIRGGVNPSGGWQTISLSASNAPVEFLTTDTTISLQSLGTLNGSGSNATRYITLNRGEWHTVQIDHLDATSTGRPIYVDGELWMYASDASSMVWSIGISNTTGNDANAGGAIYYDNILVANAVPEPSSSSVLLFSLGIVILLRRRRTARG